MPRKVKSQTTFILYQKHPENVDFELLSFMKPKKSCIALINSSLIAVYNVFRSTVFWMYSQAYGPHPLLRAASPYVPNYYGGYPPPATAGPPTTGPATGGYTLPPTAAYFPITAYTNNTNTNNSNTQPNTASVDNTQQVMMSQDSLNQQPNTPDLLMHRRTVSCSWKKYTTL